MLVMVVFFIAFRWIHLRVPLFFFNDTATTEIYTLSLHDALPIRKGRGGARKVISVRPLIRRERRWRHGGAARMAAMSNANLMQTLHRRLTRSKLLFAIDLVAAPIWAFPVRRRDLAVATRELTARRAAVSQFARPQ